MYVFLVEHREYLWGERGDSIESTVVMHPASTMDRAVSWMVRESRIHVPTKQILEDKIRGRISFYGVVRMMVDETGDGANTELMGLFDLYGNAIKNPPEQPPNPKAETVVILRPDLEPAQTLCMCPCHIPGSTMLHFTACCGPGTQFRSPNAPQYIPKGPT